MVLFTLAWAYYVGHRYDDAMKAVSRYKADYPTLFAVICVRLGRFDEARAAIADALKAGKSSRSRARVLFRRSSRSARLI